MNLKVDLRHCVIKTRPKRSRAVTPRLVCRQIFEIRLSFSLRFFSCSKSQMDPAATTPGSARPLVASESEASIASQLLPMEGGDSEMSSLATVSEPAVQQDSQKEYTEEDLVSQILVDNDSEMADAESLEEPAMEPTSPHETPPRSNQDDTVEHAAISTSENTVGLTATDVPSTLENHDTTAAESNKVPQNSTTSTETLGTALEVDVDASNSNHGTISKDAYGENAEASNKMALSNILHNQATNEENEDDDDEDDDDEDEDEDMLSELSEGGDLQVCSTVYD